MDRPDVDLPPYVLARMKQVILSTGYPIGVQELEVVEFDSQVRLATPESPTHEVTYSSAYRSHLAHFLLGSIEKVSRYFAADPADRALPLVDTNARLPTEDEQELRSRAPIDSADLLIEMSRYLRAGTTRQLLSFPLDARVERDLYRSVPEHRNRQLAYLRHQLEDLEPHFSEEIEEFAPPRVYAASSAMNCAFAQLCSDLTGLEVGAAARASRHRERGKKLRSLLEQVREPGHVGDRKAADAWAEELGLRDWYEWTRPDAGGASP